MISLIRHHHIINASIRNAIRYCPPSISTHRSPLHKHFNLSSSPSSSYTTRTMAIESLVQDAIKQNKVVVFSKSYCPYCKSAKALLKERNVKDTEVKIFELDEIEDGPAIQQYLASGKGPGKAQRTVPNIFIKEQHIGGSDDLRDFDRKGSLVKLLEGAA